MKDIGFILIVSTILWLLVDWLKPIWEASGASRYISMAVAAVGAAALVLTFRLDLLVAIGLTEQASVVGQVFAGLSITAGSGLINEIIKAVGMKVEVVEKEK